jgi:hypothetical protein
MLPPGYNRPGVGWSTLDGMVRARRIWWLAILLPGSALATGSVGLTVASFVTILCLLALLVWVDWRDARRAAEPATRTEQRG